MDMRRPSPPRARILVAMTFRLTAHPTFYASLDALEDCDETAVIAETMILRVMDAPLRAEPVGRTKVRAMRGTAPGRPALRLFYTAEEDMVTLLGLEEDRTLYE
jgi:hypothetical protein